MNIGASWPDLDQAGLRVRRMQRKLHRWAVEDSGRQFDDLFNLVYDPAFLVVAWDRVRSNKGARSAGVDGVTPRSIGTQAGRFLGELREEVKARRFTPVPVREKMIPKANGKLRRLGIPTVADRVVQAALKLVLEPIFGGLSAIFVWLPPEAPSPGRDRRDSLPRLAHAKLRVGVRGRHRGVFRRIDHTALMGRVRARIPDKRVLGLVTAFLRAGILSEDAVGRDTTTGTPQGGILSPLLANIALSVLDEHFTAKWEALGPAWTRAKHCRAGGPGSSCSGPPR